MKQEQQGLILTVVSAVIALVAAVFDVHLTGAQDTALYAAVGLVIAVILALFHISAGAAAGGLPIVDFHRVAFWVSSATVVLTALVVVFGVPLSPSQQHLLISAVGLVASCVLGTAHVSSVAAMVKARNGAGHTAPPPGSATNA